MSNKSKVFVSKEIRKAILQAMTPAQRRWIKDGEIFAVRIIHSGSRLRRWGDENNTAKITVGGACCRIYRNSLEEFAWNIDKKKARKEAANALDYFIYDGEYKIVII